MDKMLTKPILEHIENLHNNSHEHSPRAGREELLRYIEATDVGDLEPARAYLRGLDTCPRAVRLAEMPGHIGVSFPRALALAEGKPGWSAPASNLAWLASLIAPTRKLEQYYAKLNTSLSELQARPEITDPYPTYQSALAAVEALAGHVDRDPGDLTSVGLYGLKSLVNIAGQNVRYGTCQSTLRMILPSDFPAPEGHVHSFELPVGRAMSMEAYYEELHGSASAAGRLRSIVSRWYPDPSLRVPVELPASGRYTVLQIAPVIGYERPFVVEDLMPGSISLDHYGKGGSRYSPNDDELPFRIHREENASVACRNFERVILVSDAVAYYAAMIWQNR